MDRLLDKKRGQVGYKTRTAGAVRAACTSKAMCRRMTQQRQAP